MTEEIIKQTIAANISKYRKLIGLTQIELSEKINYSDKSISKWERGEGIPDITTLVQLSEIFRITVNELVYSSENAPKAAAKGNSTAKRAVPNHCFITLLSVGTAWLCGFLTVCIFRFLAPDIADVWNGRVMCYAAAAGFIVWLVLSVLWWPFVWRFICITGIIWSAALSVYVTFPVAGAWIVFAVAGVMQLLVTVCYIWKCVCEHKILKVHLFSEK